MAKEFLISDLPNIAEMQDVLQKVAKKLELIKLISEETNDLLNSIGLKGIEFSAKIGK